MLQCKTLKHKHYSGWFLHWASATLRAEPPLSLSPPPHLGTQTQPHNLPFCAAPVLVCQINVQQIIQRHSTEAAKGAAVWLEEGVTFRTPSLQLWLRSWFLLLSDLVGKNCRSSVTPLLQIMKGKKKKSMFWFLETRMPCAGPSFHLYLPLHRWTKSTFWRHTMFCETH